MARTRAPKAKVAAARATKRAAKPAPAVVVRRVAARWDAAQSTSENLKHWAMADGMSADFAAAPAVRRTLRNRCRYERDNNTYCDGLLSTLANDCVGTGPRLQMTGVSESDAEFVEREFAAWACSIDLAEKLRTMRVARGVDGEAFGVLTTNELLPTMVKLSLSLVEAEQVTSPMLIAIDRRSVDGIHFDGYGNPQSYDVLREHPGNGMGALQRFDSVPAANVLHFFVPKRPGQRRGIPEIAPALPLFAQLRRFTLSVIAAAELASDLAGVLQTDQPPSGEAADAQPFESIEVERRTFMTLPAGWKAEQMKAEQPVSTYGAFKREILSEIARCLHVPYNIAAGDSSGYNYSSGRLDHQTYFKALRVDRSRMRGQVLDRLFDAWRSEAILIEGYLPQSLRTVTTDWSHDWFWDGWEHVDPEKEANAAAIRLANNLTTLADEYGRGGNDWARKVNQRAKEIALERKLGITPVAAAPTQGGPGAQQQGDPQQEPAGSNQNAEDGSGDGTDDGEADGSVSATRIERDANGRVLAVHRPARATRAAPKTKAKAKR